MQHLARRHLFGLIAAATVAWVATPAQAAAERPWIGEPAAARALVDKGALVLDARAPALKEASPVAGAVEVVWQDFSEPELPTKGRLLADDAELTKRLQERGVRGDVPVVVLADPVQGWGEDGRIVWMLRYLGHDDAVIVDGGLPALASLGLDGIQAPALPGDFVVQRRPELIVTREQLKGELGRSDVVILDTRESREYAGETPYGETRGGHVPGAKHIWFKDLLAEDGSLLPRDALRTKLAALGVEPDSEVVTYCTGGIRSGWVTTVLNDLGFDARNFAGSMWDWSSGDPAQYPLVVAN